MIKIGYEAEEKAFISIEELKQWVSGREEEEYREDIINAVFSKEDLLEVIENINEINYIEFDYVYEKDEYEDEDDDYRNVDYLENFEIMFSDFSCKSVDEQRQGNILFFITRWVEEDIRNDLIDLHNGLSEMNRETREEERQTMIDCDICGFEKTSDEFPEDEVDAICFYCIDNSDDVGYRNNKDGEPIENKPNTTRTNRV
jgi:hypothetical protein